METCFSLFSFFKTRQQLTLENFILQQQLAVLHRLAKRPQLTRTDRLFWIVLSRCWFHWSEALLIVQPQTVLRWHQRGFRLYWAWKSRGQGRGRPFIDPAVRDLIRNMSQANPLCPPRGFTGNCLSSTFISRKPLYPNT